MRKRSQLTGLMYFRLRACIRAGIVSYPNAASLYNIEVALDLQHLRLRLYFGVEDVLCDQLKGGK